MGTRSGASGYVASCDLCHADYLGSGKTIEDLYNDMAAHGWAVVWRRGDGPKVYCPSCMGRPPERRKTP